MQQQNISGQFHRYLQTLQSTTTNTPNNQITTQRLTTALQSKLQQQIPQSQILKHQYFIQILKEVSSTILNLIFKQKTSYTHNIKHLVAYYSIFQFVLYSQKLKLGRRMYEKVSRYLHVVLGMEEIERVREIYQFSLNSNIINNFYHNIYIKGYEYRYHQVMRTFGIVQPNTTNLPLHLLKTLLESKEYNLQQFQCKITSQWLTLALIYFYLFCKYEETNQMPIFSIIIQTYIQHQSQTNNQIMDQINGDKLCQFYNNFVLQQIGKFQGLSINKLIQQTNFNEKIVSQFIVSPLYNDNNTVLDNLVFTSSLEPSLQL